VVAPPAAAAPAPWQVGLGQGAALPRAAP